MAIAHIIDYMSAQNGNHEFHAEADALHVERTVLRAFLPLTPPQAAPIPVMPPVATAVPVIEVPQAPPDSPSTLRVPPSTAGATLDQLVERFRRESGHLAASTRRKIECHFVVAKRELDFSRAVTDVKTADLRELKSRLCEGRKAASVNDIIFKGLGPLFEMAVDDGLIERSPLERVTRVKQREPERRNLCWEQAKLIEAEVARNAKETGIIVGLIRNFGVGQAEIRHLLGEHVDLANGRIHFRRKKTGKTFDVPIFDEARPFVERLKQEGRLRPGKPVVEWRNPRKALESACDRLGVERFEPRAFRRAFIVHAIEHKVDVRVIASWQGHKDASLIHRVYGKHINANYEHEEAKKLNLGKAPAVIAPENPTANSSVTPTSPPP